MVNDRKENEHAWKVVVDRVIDMGYNLNIKNSAGGGIAACIGDRDAPVEALGEEV